MIKFVTRVVKEIKAIEIVEQLVINGIGQLDLLEQSLTGTTYGGEFEGLLAYIQHFANGGNPGKKVKYLKGNKGATEFEFISKHLRVYAIQQPGKKIILYGGFKKAADSSDNIARFRLIKKEFTEFLNEQNEKGKANKK
jgi:hypothetical protein